MNSKIALILGVIFLGQFILSCVDCDCDPGTYDVDYTGIELKPYKLSGGRYVPVSDTIRREELVLFLSFKTALTRIAESQKSFGGYGFFWCLCL